MLPRLRAVAVGNLGNGGGCVLTSACASLAGEFGAQRLLQLRLEHLAGDTNRHLLRRDDLQLGQRSETS
ncbi:hypothetical protein BMJ21_08650 [Sinorhizobium medicae]|nr:hypothetical protein BMJ21_08650 [Sinorhizobium medicae]